MLSKCYSNIACFRGGLLACGDVSLGCDAVLCGVTLSA